MLLLKPNGRAKCGVLIVCIDETRPPRMPFQSSSMWSVFFVERIWQSWLADNQRTQPHTLFIETPCDFIRICTIWIGFHWEKCQPQKLCSHQILWIEHVCNFISQRNHFGSCIRFEKLFMFNLANKSSIGFFWIQQFIIHLCGPTNIYCKKSEKDAYHLLFAVFARNPISDGVWLLIRFGLVRFNAMRFGSIRFESGRQRNEIHE